jgi:hypothetical protein
MPRDCCEGLSCIAGDWQYTTDSNCLSPKSEALERRKFNPEEFGDLLSKFYETIHVSKTPHEVQTIVKKYQSEFPTLVSRLERKYGVSFEIIPTKDDDEQQEL